MTILKGIYIEFSSAKALSIAELEVSEDDKIAIIGANGSGKTTLLNLIFGEFKNFVGVLERKHDFFYLKQGDNNIEAGNETNYEFLSRMGDVSFCEDIGKYSGGEK